MEHQTPQATGYPSEDSEQEVSLLPRHLRVASDALAYQAKIARHVQQEIVGRLQRWAIDGIGRDYDDRHMRSDAVHALRKLRHIPEIVLPSLMEIRDSPSVDDLTHVEVWAACGNLGEVGPATGALTDLAEKRTKEADEVMVRVAAAKALYELGESERAVNFLITMADDRTNHAADRTLAAIALYELGESTTAEKSLSEIVSDPLIDDDRIYVAGWLGTVGGEEKEIAALSSVANNPSMPAWGRIEAASVLDPMVAGAEIAESIREIATDTDVDPVTRISAGALLADFEGTESALAILTKLLQDTSLDLVDRCRAAKALWGFGETDLALPLLVTLANQPEAYQATEPDVFWSWGLGWNQEEKTVQLLAAVASSPAATDAARFMMAEELSSPWLRESRADMAVDILSTLVEDPYIDSHLRERAQRLLETMSTRSGVGKD